MTWSRKELKKAARSVLKQQYWKLVFVSLILVFAINACGFSAGGNSYNISHDTEPFENFENFDEEDAEPIYVSTAVNQNTFIKPAVHPGMFMIGVIATAFLFIIIFLLVVLGAVILFDSFVVSPLEIGARRCTVLAYHENFLLSELVYAFKNNYLKKVKTMFLKSLYVFLWSLLLWIPGIIKKLEYSMVPYLIGEFPEMDAKEAFHRSKKMMMGQKWKAFLLKFSFIGWDIITFLPVLFMFAVIGIYNMNGMDSVSYLFCIIGMIVTLPLLLLGVFYVNPYRYLTYAGLYRKLKEQEKWEDPAEKLKENMEIPAEKKQKEGPSVYYER